MPPIERDSEELRQLLEHHSVEGYPVTVPILGDAFIIRQEGTGPVRRYTETSMELGSPQVAYVVRPARPFSFSAWVKAKGLSTTPMSLDDWMKKYGSRTRSGILPMLLAEREELERGGLVSEAEAEHGLLENAGCIGPDDSVVCGTFWQNQVFVPPDKLKNGMLVEFDEDRATLPGKIVGKSKGGKIVLLEAFTPVPYMEAPNAVANDEIKKGFYSSKTFSIGYGTRQAFEDAKIPLPPGKLIDGERQYVMNDLMDISVVEDFCKKNFPDEGHCLWQALLLYIVPIHLEGQYTGKFRPLPENMITSEYVVDYEHE